MDVPLFLKSARRRVKRLCHSWKPQVCTREERLNPVLLFCLICLLLFLGISNLRGEILLISIPLILLVGMMDLTPIPEPNLSAKWDEELYRLWEGEVVSLRCTLQNRGASIDHLEIRLNLLSGLTLVSGTISIIRPMEHGATETLELNVSGACGTYEPLSIEVIIKNRFGLSGRKHTINSKTKILILPKVAGPKGMILRPHRVRQQTGVNLSRQGGEGIDTYGIREYQPGDPIRYISGRASARHPRSLFVREFERERVANVILAVDTSALGKSSGTNPVLSHCIEATAMLSNALIDSGNRVGLFVFGNYSNWVFPGSGKLQKEKILRALAFDVNGNKSLDSKLASFPTRFLTPRSLILMISPLLGPDPWMLYSLKGHRHQVLVISPDEITGRNWEKTSDKAQNLAFRASRLERDLLVNRLAEQNIPVFNWSLNSSNEVSLSRFLGRYWL